MQYGQEILNQLCKITELLSKNNTNKKIYLTTEDLMERWQCSYNHANAFMHRRGSGAIKPAKRHLISLKEVEAHERTTTVKTG